MLRGCVIVLMAFFKAAGETKTFIQDPYYLECRSLGIKCHQKAICQLDQVTKTFFCECLPGYVGDGLDYCQEPSVKVTVSNTSVCSGIGQQVCVLTRMPGDEAVLSVSIKGNFSQDQITWYKFYSSQGPDYNSYRRRLSPPADPIPEIGLVKHSLTLKLYYLNEDDFYPNKFWVEMKPNKLPERMINIEPYGLTGFEKLNPSPLRYFFVLERMPLGVGEFLEGDTVVIELTHEFNTTLSSFVQWIKEPDDLTLCGNRSTIIANDTVGIQIKGINNRNFGYIRAVIYDFTPLIPGRIMIAQRLFLLKKDISKVCNGERSERNCHCNPGFVGNGIHCIDIDECVQGMPLKCLPETTCINTYGSYICKCPYGFEGDGLYSCIDIDECARKIDNCNKNATCVNTLGSYVCMCKSGFIGDGTKCTARSMWTPWSPWSICSGTCGFEQQMRIRMCTHPESGMRCKGPSTDLKPCPVTSPCPVNGQWSDWSPWSLCSHTCSGVKKRVRICNNPVPSNEGQPCSGEKDQVIPCYSDKCPVDGMWSPWASWTPCPQSCGLGTVKRSRRCNNPAPENGGKKCVGFGYEEGSCGFLKEYCKYLSQSWQEKSSIETL